MTTLCEIVTIEITTKPPELRVIIFDIILVAALATMFCFTMRK